MAFREDFGGMTTEPSNEEVKADIGGPQVKWKIWPVIDAFTKGKI